MTHGATPAETPGATPAASTGATTGAASDAASALERDARDPLACFAAEFHHPFDSSGRRVVYLCGHSLGLQPKSAAQYVEQELQDWRRLGVLGHHAAERPWIPYHEQATAPLAALVGALDSEVVAMNSLTVNLHLMLVSFFRPAGERNRVLIEKSAFPSDRHAVVSQLAFHGLTAAEHLLEMEPRPGERTLRTEDVIRRIEQEGTRLALVLLPGVQYLTGQSLDLGPMISAARRAGAAAGLDLAHAIGNTPLSLHEWNADFAVWCSYKYLNAGPGAIGGCFVHERHARSVDLPRFAGWWGHDPKTRFHMGPEFTPIPGAQGWQISNPPVLSTAPLLASLEIFQRAGLGRLREKSIALTGFLQGLIETRLPDLIDIITPGAASERGCQLSLRIARSPAAAKRCHDLLTAAGVAADWREPDVLRLAPVPLYNSYSDVFAAVDALSRAVRQ
ncbi:MAG TPA: kynureninase [Steroidobacteraceae bacterium]|nr:kynureninase [Steroidobacteraceae bacterium]